MWKILEDEDPSRRNRAQPERSLYSAVLQTAVRDLGIGVIGGYRLRGLAIDWFDGSDAHVTFLECCEVLGLESGAVLLALQEQGLLPYPVPQNAAQRIEEVVLFV